MALANTTRLANRYGLDLKFYKLTGEETNGIPASETEPDLVLDFANEISFEITGDSVFATGEQGHRNLIGFNNPLEGSMTISTQIITPALMKLITADTDSAGMGAVFKTRPDAAYYYVTGQTVWKDEAGITYDETLTVYKCMFQVNYSASYTGDGDPHSIDINLDLFETSNGMIKLDYADQTSDDEEDDEEEGETP